MATINVSSKTSSSVTVSISGISAGTYYEVGAMNTSNGIIEVTKTAQAPSLSFGVTIDGLTPNTSYLLYVSVGSEQAWTPSAVTTDAQSSTASPSFVISTVGYNSVGITVQYVEVGTLIDFYCRNTSTSVATWKSSVETTSSPFYYTFTGLEPETEYVFNVRLGGSWIREGGLTITTDAPAIALWSWSASNGSATAYQTDLAHAAVTNKGATGNFSYLVWNDLVNKVSKCCTASRGTWNNSYATYSQAIMTQYNTELTAAMFNAVRYNIGSRVATGISEVSTGDPILGSYFTTLTTALNTWIESINKANE